MKIVTGILKREPSLDFQTAQTAGALGLKDREVLAASARDNRILVSHDRETMPAHFADFTTESTSPGLIIVSQNIEMRAAIEQILLIWAASNMEEWSNRIGYLPL